jgi:hypothetical protein
MVLDDIARAMVLQYRDAIQARTILMLADGIAGGDGAACRAAKTDRP